MAFPWGEAGAAIALSGLLLILATAPVPLIFPADVETHEGRTVRVAGFVDDVQTGVDSTRGALVLAGHAVRFEAEGLDAMAEGTWVELRGTLHRYNGALILHVETNRWTS